MANIKFADFRGKPIEPKPMFSARKYESLNQILNNANQWIERNEIDVLNVETVLLPNSEPKKKDNATHWAHANWGWSQIVRVWYRVE